MPNECADCLRQGRWGSIKQNRPAEGLRQYDRLLRRVWHCTDVMTDGVEQLAESFLK